MNGQFFIDVVKRFKAVKCENPHNNAQNDSCLYFHNESDKRRELFGTKNGDLSYNNILYLPGKTPETEKYTFAQNLAEYRYHIQNYKTRYCLYLKINGKCDFNQFCPFIHPDDKLDELNTLRKKYISYSSETPINLHISSIKEASTSDCSSPEISPSKSPIQIHKKNSKFLYLLENNKEAYVYGEQVDFHEDNEHEFKQSTREFKFFMNVLTEYICSFVNTNGGTIYFGIQDSGHILGTKIKNGSIDRYVWALKEIRKSFHPALGEEIKIDVEVKPVIEIKYNFPLCMKDTYILEYHIGKGRPNIVYTTHEGKVFIRLSASSPELKGVELVNFVKAKCLLKN